MNELPFDPTVFEFLIHMLEFSVVLGIAVIVYITKKHSTKINEELEKRLENEMDTTSEE